MNCRESCQGGLKQHGPMPRPAGVPPSAILLGVAVGGVDALELGMRPRVDLPLQLLELLQSEILARTDLAAHEPRHMLVQELVRLPSMCRQKGRARHDLPGPGQVPSRQRPGAGAGDRRCIHVCARAHPCSNSRGGTLLQQHLLLRGGNASSIVTVGVCTPRGLRGHQGRKRGDANNEKDREGDLRGHHHHGGVSRAMSEGQQPEPASPKQAGDGKANGRLRSA
mmetsp:Transcript_21963/g.55407  ORF Transcript_21963/g.55407 Transcript_21963/m.55407 type:complete len:224 (+) Transcript_21963:736-1407(+)